MEQTEPIFTLTHLGYTKYTVRNPLNSLRKTMLSILLLVTQMFVLETYMCFFNSVEQDYLENTEPIFTLKSLTCKKYSFLEKLTQFSRERVL